VNAFFALSTYAVLSTGVLSFTTVVFAAVGGFLSAQMVEKVRSVALAGFSPGGARRWVGGRVCRRRVPSP